MKVPFTIAASLALLVALRDSAHAEPASTSPSQGGPDVHVGAAGIYRHLSDIPLLGAGLSLGIARKQPVSSGGTLRIASAHTAAGLAAFEVALTTSLEVHPIDELRFHIGIGLDVLGVSRATTHDTILALGPSLLAGLGLETGRSGIYVLVDIEAMTYGSGHETIYDWGPTLTVGYRF